MTAAFLLFHDSDGTHRGFELPRTGERVTIGRLPGNDVVLKWDTEVSRLHAALERDGSAWTLVDSGLSRNGCYVNNTRVLGRHRLHTGDLLRFGKSVVAYIEREHGAARPSATQPPGGDRQQATI
jgi:pSer/pThr/pTyr-binding forkhead associated (FHA) protein